MNRHQQQLGTARPDDHRRERRRVAASLEAVDTDRDPGHRAGILIGVGRRAALAGMCQVRHRLSDVRLTVVATDGRR